MTDRNGDLVKRAEAALASLPLREPDWDGFASRIDGAVGAAPAEDEALFSAPLPANEEDGEVPAVTAPADDSVPAPRATVAAAAADAEDLTAEAASEDSAPVASAEPPESRREPVSLADLARASVARRGSSERASIAKESLAVASQSRAQDPDVAQRVHAAAAYAPSSVAPPPPSARAANGGPGARLSALVPGAVIAAIGIAAAVSYTHLTLPTKRIV